MSIRALGMRLFKHGKGYLKFIRRDYNSTNITEKINVVQQASAQTGEVSNNSQILLRNFTLRNVGTQVGLQARRILIDNVLNRVTNSLSSDLRKKATRKIFFGDSGPFFALVGVSLASGTGILTKEEELEGVCWEIREAISKIKWTYNESNIDEKRLETEKISLKDLELKHPIAKGSNAVVYAAKLKDESNQQKTEEKVNIESYPLALKMMFNYDIQSSSMAILKAMYRETIPARIYYSNVSVSDWEIDLSNRVRHLPPHPNIISIYSVFTDYIPELKEARDLYPAALPQRIHPEGEGRNMSLFLLMKRYDCSLQQFLSSSSLQMRVRILLLTQLLEGVAHLTAHSIAHRDLKSDNLLLDTIEPQAPILVITDFGCCLSDKANGLHVPFNSYEVDRGGNTALMAPEIITQTPGIFSVLNYSKADLWSAATIAYEIFGMSNPFFECNGKNRLMNVNYKENELPKLPDEVPSVFKALIKNLLMRNPNKRLDPEVAANICQLYLWAPSSWLKPEISKLPSSTEILQWLLSLTTKVLCEGRLMNKFSLQFNDTKNFNNKAYSRNSGRRTYPEYLLISSFLRRVKLVNIHSALTWIHNNI